jgi:hypothetical protein
VGQWRLVYELPGWAVGQWRLVYELPGWALEQWMCRNYSNGTVNSHKL